MAEKRDQNWGNTKFTESELRFLINCQHAAGDMEASELVRKCLAIAIPQLIHNQFLRRVELEDIMDSMSRSVS